MNAEVNDAEPEDAAVEAEDMAYQLAEDALNEEEITIECSACNVILAIDEVILNTLAPEGKLKRSSVDNLLKLAQVRALYLKS